MPIPKKRSQDFKQTVNTEEKSSPLKGLSTSERAIMAEKERLEKAKEGEDGEIKPESSQVADKSSDLKESEPSERKDTKVDTKEAEIEKPTSDESPGKKRGR